MTETMTREEEALALLEGLTEPQKRAVDLMKVLLDCFNAGGGEGRLKGEGRYESLSAIVPLAATQAGKSLETFWALLLDRMMLAVPPVFMDKWYLPLLKHENPIEVLNVLRTEAKFIVPLARHIHREAKFSDPAYAEAIEKAQEERRKAKEVAEKEDSGQEEMNV
jgi:hypothetical protein